MSSGCKAAVGCVDARVPVRACYVNLYKWPESDVEFVKSVARGGDKSLSVDDGDGNSGTGHSRGWAQRPMVVDSYSCRQMYLRSYTFSKKESMSEKTRRCLDKVKEKTVLFHQRRESSGSISSIDGSHKNKNQKKKKKKKKKTRKTRTLREISCSALYSIFRRLLFCTTSVDVVDGQPPQ